MKVKDDLVKVWGDAPDGKINIEVKLQMYDYDNVLGLINNLWRKGWNVKAVEWIPNYYSQKNRKGIFLPKDIINQAAFEPKPYHLNRLNQFKLELLPFQRFGQTKAVTDLMQAQTANKLTAKPNVGNLILGFDYYSIADFKNHVQLYDFIIRLTKGKWNKKIYKPRSVFLIYLDERKVEIDYSTKLLLEKAVVLADYYKVHWQEAIDGLLQINSLLFEESFTREDTTYKLLKLVDKAQQLQKAFVRVEVTGKVTDYLCLKSVNDYRLFIKHTVGKQDYNL